MSMPQGLRIYLAGDSTVQTYAEELAPQAGWGQFIGGFFTPEVTFVNRAIGGRSSKTFVEEGRLAAILEAIRPGDELWIQMGHNDATASKPERYTDPDTEYKAYLSRYIEGAREKGALPVLITPVGRLHREDGAYVNDFPAYCRAMKELALEKNVTCIDLMTASLKAFAAAGPEEAESYFMVSVNGTDHTHFTEQGAKAMAEVLAGEIEGSGLPAAAFLRRKLRA